MYQLLEVSFNYENVISPFIEELSGNQDDLAQEWYMDKHYQLMKMYQGYFNRR